MPRHVLFLLFNALTNLFALTTEFTENTGDTRIVSNNESCDLIRDIRDIRGE